MESSKIFGPQNQVGTKLWLAPLVPDSAPVGTKKKSFKFLTLMAVNSCDWPVRPSPLLQYWHRVHFLILLTTLFNLGSIFFKNFSINYWRQALCATYYIPSQTDIFLYSSSFNFSLLTQERCSDKLSADKSKLTK